MPLPQISVTAAFAGFPGPDDFVFDDADRGFDEGNFVDGESVDISTDVAAPLIVRRGRQTALDVVVPGVAQVMLDDTDRTYDNEHASSPYVGQMEPNREFTIAAFGVPIFRGRLTTGDRAEGQDPDTLMALSLEDSLAFLARTEFDGWTSTAQLPGARIEAILDRPEVGFSTVARDIDTGVHSLQSDPVSAGSNPLNYAQLVAKSDRGLFFASRSDVPTYRDYKTDPPVVRSLKDDGTAVEPSQVQRQIGGRLWFNRVTVDREGGTAQTAALTDTEIAAQGGIRAYQRRGLLLDSNSASLSQAQDILDEYSSPVMRVRSATIEIHALTTDEAVDWVAVELGDQVDVDYQPSATGARVVGSFIVGSIEHRIQERRYLLTLGLEVPVSSTVAEPPAGGPGVASEDPIMANAYVYQDGTDTIAVRRDGTVISQLSTNAANNATVIQAAIDDVAGTQTFGTASTVGYGGGGTVELSGDLYELSDNIELKYGVSLKGQGCSFDRYGFVETAHSMQGTVLAPTSGLPTEDVEDGAGTTNQRPCILVGRLVSGSTQSTTNPHGCRISDLGIWMRSANTGQGVLICDTQYVRLRDVVVTGANGTDGAGFRVISSLAPDDGAHANELIDCWANYCTRGLDVNGSGSTDGYVRGGRFLQCIDRSISLGQNGGGGGWQISDAHFTAGSGQADPHIAVQAGPCIINACYFDTNDGYDITTDTAGTIITGCYHKAGTTGGPAAVKATGNGKRLVCVGNFGVAGPLTDGYIEFDDQSGDDYRPVVVGVTLGDNGNSPNGVAVTSAGANLGEVDSALDTNESNGANAILHHLQMVTTAL